MTQQEVQALAAKIVNRDIVNRRGLFHITSAKAEYSSYHKQWKIEARCSVASHRLCADNLVSGTTAMGENVFMLTITEAQKLINSKPKKKSQTYSIERITNFDIAREIINELDINKDLRLSLMNSLLSLESEEDWVRLKQKLVVLLLK